MFLARSCWFLYLASYKWHPCILIKNIPSPMLILWSPLDTSLSHFIPNDKRLHNLSPTKTCCRFTKDKSILSLTVGSQVTSTMKIHLGRHEKLFLTRSKQEDTGLRLSESQYNKEDPSDIFLPDIFSDSEFSYSSPEGRKP